MSIELVMLFNHLVLYSLILRGTAGHINHRLAIHIGIQLIQIPICTWLWIKIYKYIISSVKNWSKRKVQSFSDCTPKTSVQLSHSAMYDSLRPHESQHARPLCPSPTPRVHPNLSIKSVMPCNHLILCRPLLLLPSIFPSIRVLSNESARHITGQSIGVSASTSVLPMNTQDWFHLAWTGWISLQSKGLFQESSPTPQFKNINSSALSFLYSPTLTSTHDHWKNHSLD